MALTETSAVRFSGRVYRLRSTQVVLLSLLLSGHFWLEVETRERHFRFIQRPCAAQQTRLIQCFRR